MSNLKALYIRRLREAGQVKRCHAMVHSDIGYTDGKHSFDAVSMLFILHPGPSMDLVKFLLWHDMGERWAGDAPASAKRADPVFDQAYRNLEIKALNAVLPIVSALIEKLSTDDLQWAKAIDALEFWIWCEDQLAIGNRNVISALNDTKEAMENAWKEGTLPTEVRDFITNGGTNWVCLPQRYDR